MNKMLLKIIKLISSIAVWTFVLFCIVTVLKRYINKLPSYQGYLMNRKLNNLKYILVWSKGEKEWDCLKDKQTAFIENQCDYSNCYVTYDKTLLNDDYTDFDAIVFNGKHISLNESCALPEKRSPRQFYVFANKEAAVYYPICNEKFDNYFNLTWTYRLDSDVPWTYFTIYTFDGGQIGPKIDMSWMEYNTSLKTDMVVAVKEYTAVLAVGSNESIPTDILMFISQIDSALRGLNHVLKIVDSDEFSNCTLKDDKECLQLLKQYYFYLAFENVVADDYVTEKVLNPLKANVVPVVYGGANYSRFLPPHSFIDARVLGFDKTIKTIIELTQNSTAYMQYLSWYKHYFYSATNRPAVCGLCAALNKNGRKVYKDFRKWWYPKPLCYSFKGKKIITGQAHVGPRAM